MRNLAQQFFCIDERAHGNPPQLASKQIGRACEIKPPNPDERGSTAASRNWFSVETLTLVLAAAIALAFVLSSYVLRDPHLNGGSIDKTAVKALVERTIAIESNGDPNARNKRSSATGAGQLLDDTWLEAVRRHRRDLMQGRSDKEVLELRRDAELAREIVTRLVEQYATMLSKRRLPITPGSLYLTYFAGPAGAVALLSGEENADAASLIDPAGLARSCTRG